MVHATTGGRHRRIPNRDGRYVIAGVAALPSMSFFERERARFMLAHDRGTTGPRRTPEKPESETPMPQGTLHDRSVDLAELTEELRELFRAHLPSGYLQGKTEIRDAVASLLECSLLEAETLVDELESHHMIEFEGNPMEEPVLPTGWTFR
jgi:hypothetical protein